MTTGYTTDTLNIAPRSARSEKRSYLRLLPGALPGHHLHLQDPAADPLLLLQPDRALPADRLHGGARLHAAAGLGGEAQSRYLDSGHAVDGGW